MSDRSQPTANTPISAPQKHQDPYDAYQRWKNQPLDQKPHLSIVIPAYNEEIRIIPTIGAIASHVSGLGFPWELLIADDGSTDETVNMVRDLGFVNLNLLEAERNGGKGNAVQRGMLAAKGDYVLFTDADNSTPIEEVENLLHKLEHEGYDVAVGSRAAEGAQVSNKSAFRQLMSDGLRWINRVLFGIRVKDTQCGFKMYSQAAAHRLHSAQTLMGFSFDLEILYLAAKFGYKIAEVPVDWIDAPGSKVDASKEALRFIRDLAKIRWNDIKGAYR